MKINKYRTVVYISHPSGGLQSNTYKVEKIIKQLHKLFPDILFVSPIHCFGFMYDEVPYKEGLEYCLWLLNQCDEVWAFGNYQDSTGCLCEIEYCKNKGIPYKNFTSGECYRKLNEPNIECLNEKCPLCDEDNGSVYCGIKAINNKIKNC